MNISNIYSKYKIPPNLQLHMLRVAAVGNEIANNWKQKSVINVDRVIKTLLLHDMANIIVFDFDKSPHLLGDEEKKLDYWKSIKKEFTEKYGNDEHQAVLEITHDIGLEEKGIEILRRMPETDNEHKIENENWELAICWYSDFRVAPYGVTSINDRLDDLIKRRKVRGVEEKVIIHLEGIRKYGLEVEKEIQKEASINLASITEIAITAVRNSLINLMY